jgi:hypothetical protein
MVVLVSVVSAFFQGRRLWPRRAGDCGPKCVFAVFVRSFGPEPPGTFARPETPTLGSGDSSRRDFWSGARLCNGFGDFVTRGRRLGAGDSVSRPRILSISGGIFFSFLFCLR